MGKRILTPAYEAILSTLLSQFEAEFDRSLQEINVAVSPYTRFIRTKQQQLEEQREEFTTIPKWLERQKKDLDVL
jgi:hypothetical protein